MPPSNLLRAATYITLLLGALWVLFATEVSFPDDVETWMPGPLPGEVVHTLGDAPDGPLVGTESGLYELTPNGEAEPWLGFSGAVYCVVPGEETYLGTDDGVRGLDRSRGFIRKELKGHSVYALARSGGGLYAATEAGLYRKRSGEWERAWSGSGKTRVNAVLAVGDGVLFGGEEGLFRTRGGVAERVAEGSVVSLSRVGEGGARLWAGFRGEPYLLASEDGGRSWDSAAEGVGLHTTNALVAESGGSDRLYLGGGGVFDGEGTAGVMFSDNGGESWQTRQDRLSTTPVLSMTARREPLVVDISVRPLFEVRSPLPVSETRLYAGTNGSGIYTYRVPGPLLSLLGTLGPAGRLVEPAILGLLLLVVVWKLYQRRRYPKRDTAGNTSERD